jgi:ERF superfamily protein
MGDEIKPLNLRQKLMAAMGDVGGVAKKGQNKGEGGYKYQRAADIFPKVQQAFIAHGICFVADELSKTCHEPHSTKSGGVMFVWDVLMQFRILDTESDEIIEGKASGLGFDTSDKSLNKARTAALKYFLKQTLLIGEDEDDSDADTPEVIVHNPKGVACPSCGNVGSILKDNNGKEEWFCWGKRGGCGARFYTDPAIRPEVSGPKPPTDIPQGTVSPQHRKALWASVLARAKQLGLGKEEAYTWLETEMLNLGVPPGEDGRPSSEHLKAPQYQKILASIATATMGETTSEKDVEW